MCTNRSRNQPCRQLLPIWQDCHWMWLQAPDVALQKASSDRLGENAQFFIEEPTVCFLQCRSAAEALNGSLAASHPLLTVRPASKRMSYVCHMCAMCVLSI